MDREKNVVDFYVLCNKLKDLVRTGWKTWGVKRSRVESVAEHIFGVQMLAIAMWSEYKYDVDICKVITMLAVHEMEEIVIGDITCFDSNYTKKQELGRVAVAKVFEKLTNAENIHNLVLEFDERKTDEAKFAYFCDKLECDIQAKLYDNESCVDLLKQENNSVLKNDDVKKLLDKGMSWSDMWIEYGQNKYGYDKNFLEVSNFVKRNID